MNDLNAVTSYSNLTYEQIAVGASVEVAHSVTRDDVALLALVSGDASVLAADGLPAGQR